MPSAMQVHYEKNLPITHRTGKSICTGQETISNTKLEPVQARVRPPNTLVEPTMKIRFNEHSPLFLPYSFSSAPLQLQSTELITESGEVLVYYIQWWHHHFEGRAGIILQAE